jgi:hypothetical protein
LQRSAGQEKSVTSVEAEQGLPTLRAEILDVVSFVEDEVVPRFASEDVLIGEDELVRSDADVEGVLGVPSLSLLLSLLLSSVVHHELEPRQELAELHLPIEHNTRRNDDEVRTPLSFVTREMGEERNRLNRFTETHLVGENSEGVSIEKSGSATTE